MTPKKTEYTLNLSGGDITVKDRIVLEGTAFEIMRLIMNPSSGVNSFTEHDGHIPTGPELAIDSQNTRLSPKAFMASKKPASEIERVTCLAYYMNKYRNITAFKTRDITKINTESAQPNFSNATAFCRNADDAGYLSKAGGGSKQITVLGEAIVEALPDRAQVKIAIENNKVGRKRQSRKTRKTKKKTA